MVFSSVTFLFLFLPIVLGLYHLLLLPWTLGSRRRIWLRLANTFLMAVSLLFYAWGEKQLVFLFIGTTFLDFMAALLICGGLWQRNIEQLKPQAPRTRFQRGVLIASILANLSILLYFKYFNFFVESYNEVAGGLGLAKLSWASLHKVALPLGISFFTFHSMSYVIDVYRGHVRATRNFIDYACYVLMFPQLVAGPIVRFSYVANSLVERVVTARYFASGVMTFSLGLAKKVLIANNVALAADRIFALRPEQLSPSLAWLGAIAYTLQIYFDFSGYSDMAIGLGRMLGFELPQNFNFPYIARSVREFWRRWHISLSTWFQDYLYIPLGGSRASSLRTYFNLVLVFFLCGLWHGASWTFVVWGLYHGGFLVLERQASFARLLHRLGRLSHVYTMLVAICGWVLFRAESFGQAVAFFRAMSGRGGADPTYPLRWFLTNDVALALLFGAVLAAPIRQAVSDALDGWLKKARAAVSPVGVGPTPLAVAVLEPSLVLVRAACVLALLLACSMSLATGTYNPFIYFRF
ncbi:MAG TPA: MBOAT family O-acyltransferase [Pseudomonadota bacterium]|nr:MBOAT family O-acyltransferase [Pseudomonadota bacterium]